MKNTGIKVAVIVLLCMVATSAILAQIVYAQPPSPARSVPLKVGQVPVANVLRQLGAKLERGSEAKEIDGYSSHFDRMDTNKDGKHTREEYVDKGGYMTPQARAGIFRAADGNANGVVTKAEYVLNRIITDEAKAIVQGMDDDKDGLVEQAEFVKHVAKLLSDVELAEQVYAALDANADGGIPIPEYLRVWGQWARAGRKSAEQRIAARRAEFADVAKKPSRRPARPGEGRPAGGPPSGRPGAGSAPPSVSEVFERFDRNKDGKLQKNEIPEFAQQFILPADVDGDDMVTKKELQALRQRQRPGRGGRPARGAPRPPTGPPTGKPSGGKGRPPGLRPAEDRKQIYNRKKAFLRQDLNGDETVSAQEYNGPPKVFKELDTDGNGKLSLEEAKWMMTFSPIPSGSFMMGSKASVHKVNIDAFQMSTTEVTTAQFCQYLNAALKAGEVTVKLSDASGMGVRIFIPIPAYEVFGAPGAKFAGKSYILLSPVSGLSHIKVAEHPINIPEHPLNQSWIDYVPDMKRFYVRPGFEDWPAVSVRWYGAYAFAEHYGLSLPTEAEWEYAASGGKQFKWATNNGEISGKNANYKCFSGTESQDQWIGYRIAVGSYEPNPFDIFDLGGNVWEWALDWYREDFYLYCMDNNITRNPVNLDGEEPPKDAKGGPRGGFTHDARVTRGGSYQYHQATLGTAYRNRSYPFRGNDHWGCRVVLRPSSTVFNGKDQDFVPH